MALSRRQRWVGQAAHDACVPASRRHVDQVNPAGARGGDYVQSEDSYPFYLERLTNTFAPSSTRAGFSLSPTLRSVRNA